MRLHVVSLPHTQTTSEFSACAFTEKVRKFCVMMKGLGHDVFLYAGDQNEAPCTELITCVTEEERRNFVGKKSFIEASFDSSLPHWQMFNNRVAKEIKLRADKHDFVCVIGGHANKPIADALPYLVTVEFGIGYGGTFAKHRVWESYAWMHTCYGAATNNNPNAADGVWYDEVIPGYFEPEKFPFSAEKDDYYLFIGRLTERKGPQVAADVCKYINRKLIVAGQGTPPEGTEYVGLVGPEERGRLMSRAKAVFVPTIYIEPFGNVAVEAQACGTPVICTDWGAMTETVVHGSTGYRCRSFREFVEAALNTDKLTPAVIRHHAITNYSLSVIGRRYEDYFKRLGTLWGKGWYEMDM